MIRPGMWHVEVIDCPNISDCSGTFISRLSYNASCSPDTVIQIVPLQKTAPDGSPSVAQKENHQVQNLLIIAYAACDKLHRYIILLPFKLRFQFHVDTRY